jgi:hypothetical protein
MYRSRSLTAIAQFLQLKEYAGQIFQSFKENLDVVDKNVWTVKHHMERSHDIVWNPHYKMEDH